MHDTMQPTKPAVPVAPPPTLTADQQTKLRTRAPKAGLGDIEDLLLELEIPKSKWFEPLLWMMRDQGARIGHHWQIVWALANLERPLPIEDAVWLVEQLGEQLAFRGKELVLHATSPLLPGWHPTLEQIVMRSFEGHLEQLRAVKVTDAFRLGILYARGQLGDELSQAEQAEVRAALARSYVTMAGSCSVMIPTDGELVEHAVEFPVEEDHPWDAIVGPFGSPEAWARAVWEAAAANERDASPERPTLHVDRVLRHAEHARPEELGIVLAFGYIDDGACDGELGELARKHLGELDADTKRTVRKAIHEVAELTEREVPRELGAVLADDGAVLAAEIAALAAASGHACDVRIYVPVLGEPSVNGVAQVAPEIYGLDDTPTFEGEMMEPLITLDLAEVPELQQRFGSEAVAFFISNRSNNNASEDDSGEVAVMRLSVEQARDLDEGTPFRLVAIDVPGAAFDGAPPDSLEELATKIGALPMRVLGPPSFIQDEARSDGFVLQLNEDFIDANFGGGVMYLYEDDGFWQC